MHDFTLDENARTSADDLLDEMLVNAHAALVDAIAAQQYRSVVAEVTSRPDRHVAPEGRSAREDTLIDQLAEQWEVHAGREEIVFAGPALRAALDALHRVYVAFREAEDCLSGRSSMQLGAAARLVGAMSVGLAGRTADRAMAEESFSRLMALIVKLKSNEELDDRTRGKLEELLYDAYEAVEYLFDASDDFEGAPA